MQAAQPLSTPLTQRISDAQLLLADVAKRFSPATLASSLAAEDMVLTDMILRTGLPINIFTLETGRLPKESLEMLDKIKQHYGVEIETYRPDPAAVDEYVKNHGLNAFYESVDLRKTCCGIRKVEPLKRALTGKRAWITGMRREQSVTRGELDVQEYDSAHALEKFNPLAGWLEGDVWDYIQTFSVPYNALHDRGYPSIGCDPCTRAIKPGEDIRAGRWWWENADNKECGLHVQPVEFRKP
ncbi:MAG: phosphoadenylyl-sulfate reductase [Burkholderiaceae bacterium]|nr:MAG: phosphoadenylyl-sulfate reductase [Burkholderiaceae bacterium]